jgi:hypothetical protein
MKDFCRAIMILLILAPWAIAQQDPDDPGIQDSIIILSTVVDHPMRSAIVDICVVSDEPIAAYNLPLRWVPQNDSIYPSDLIYYHLQGWEFLFDSISLENHFISMRGAADTAILNTGGVRDTIWGVHFQIANFSPQIIHIDSTFDDRNGSVAFYLPDGRTEITPAFVGGNLIYDPLSGTENQSPMPGNFSLMQNYPNPFNAQTTISYSLPVSAPVNLTIYNIFGQKVTSLYDGVQTAGEHQVVWDAKDMTSGIYFYTIKSGQYTQAMKCLLAK